MWQQWRVLNAQWPKISLKATQNDSEVSWATLTHDALHEFRVALVRDTAQGFAVCMLWAATQRQRSLLETARLRYYMLTAVLDCACALTETRWLNHKKRKKNTYQVSIPLYYLVGESLVLKMNQLLVWVLFIENHTEWVWPGSDSKHVAAVLCCVFV